MNKILRPLSQTTLFTLIAGANLAACTGVQRAKMPNQVIAESVQDLQGSFTPTIGYCGGTPDGTVVGGDGEVRTLIVQGSTWKEVSTRVTLDNNGNVMTKNTEEVIARILSRDPNAKTITLQFKLRRATFTMPGLPGHAPDVREDPDLADSAPVVLSYASIDRSGANFSVQADSSQVESVLPKLNAACDSYSIGLKRN